MTRQVVIALIAVLMVAGCPKNRAPDEPLEPSGPLAVMKDSSASFSSAAADQDGDSVAIRFDWGDGDTSDWSLNVAAGEPISMTYAWTEVAVCSVRAQAKDEKGLASAWSLARAVNVVEEHPPDVPSVPSGPTEVAEDSLASFSSTATDPDGDSVAIRFDWGDGDTSDWSQYVAPGDSASIKHAWPAVAVCSVRAQAIDRKGLTSAWSAAHVVQVANRHAPNTPFVPSGPTEVAKDSLASFLSSATDPDGDSVAIRFDWGDGDTSDWSSLVESGTSASDTHRWSSADTYEVRAQARDAHGASSAWSGPHAVGVVSVPPTRARWVYRYAGAECIVYAGRPLTRDASGNVYVAGWRYSPVTDDDIIVISLNPDGDTNWTYVYNGPGNGNDRANAIVCGADGNLYIAGVAEGAGTHNDFTVISITPNGGQRWVYTRSGQMPGYYNDFARAVMYGGDGNIYVAGVLCEYGYEDYVVISLTSTGSERWAYIRDLSTWDTACDLVWGADGDVYVTGWSRGPGGSLDFRLVGLRPNGTEKWTYTYVQSNGDDRGPYIAYGLDNNLYVAGGTKPGGSGNDIIVISVDTLGQRRWMHTYNGPGNGDDNACPVVVGSDGCVYTAGEATGSGSRKDMLVMSLTSSGSQNWLSTFNGPGNSDDEFYALACASGGGLYTAGYSTGTSTGKDLVVMSLTGAGDTTWSYRYNGTGNGTDACYSLVTGSGGTLYAAGVSHGSDTTDIVVISLATTLGMPDRGPAVPAAPHRVIRRPAEFPAETAPNRPRAVPIRAKGKGTR